MFFSFFDCQNQLKNMKWPKGRASARASIYIEMNCEYMSTICASLYQTADERPLLKRVNDMLLIVWSSYSLHSLHVCCFKFRAGHCDKEPTIVWGALNWCKAAEAKFFLLPYSWLSHLDALYISCTIVWPMLFPVSIQRPVYACGRYIAK
jgi:hypothetical protein